MAEAVIDPQRRRHVRRTVLVLAVVVFALYFGFIVYSVMHAHH